MNTTTTSMSLLVAVNQAESIRRGIAAPDSTIKLDFDPSYLASATRSWIADRFGAGRLFRHRGGPSLLSVPEPSMDGLLEAITKAMAEDAAEAEARAAKRQADAKENRADTLAALAKGPQELYHTVQIWKNGWALCDGGIASQRPDDLGAVSESKESLSTTYHLRRIVWPLRFDAEVKAGAKDLEAELATEKAANHAAAVARLRAALAERQAEADAKAARRSTQLDDKAEEIGGTLAERWKAGFAAESEIVGAIQRDALAARGLTTSGGNFDRDEFATFDGPLSDAQFLALQDFRSKLPDGTEIILRQAWNEFKEEDEDGEETGEIGRSSHLLYAEAWFREGEISVNAQEALPGVPLN